MSLLVRWVLKWTGLQWCQPDVTNRVGQGWGLGGLMSDVWEWGPMSDVWGVPCLMSGVGVPCLMSGGCTVRSIASWIMLIWGTLPVNRQAWVKILHSHTFIGGGKDCMFQQKLKKSITGWPTRNVYRLILKVIVRVLVRLLHLFVGTSMLLFAGIQKGGDPSLKWLVTTQTNIMKPGGNGRLDIQ